MNTNFFNQIAQLDITGNFQMTISKGTDNTLVVLIMLQNEQCGDEARRMIPPLNLRGTAEELDNGFFESIATPIQTVSGLVVNMEGFMKQLEEAKKHSAMEKEKTDREKKAQEEMDKKYREAMAKVDELEKEGRYREAWVKVPDPVQFPQQAKAIRKRKASLSAKFVPDLFGASEAGVVTIEQQAENTHFSTERDNEEIPDDAEDNWEDDNEVS